MPSKTKINVIIFKSKVPENQKKLMRKSAKEDYPWYLLKA